MAITIAYKTWVEEAKKRYKSSKEIRLRCPVCGHVATVAEYDEAGAPDGAIGFSCIGRWLKDDTKVREAFGNHSKQKFPGPCNYTGGGLIGLNPIRVIFDDGSASTFFDFADDPLDTGDVDVCEINVTDTETLKRLESLPCPYFESVQRQSICENFAMDGKTGWCQHLIESTGYCKIKTNTEEM